MAGIVKILMLLKDKGALLQEIDPWVKRFGGLGFFIIAIQLSSSIDNLAGDTSNIKKNLQELTISVATMMERTQTQKELLLSHSIDIAEIKHRLTSLEKAQNKGDK